MIYLCTYQPGYINLFSFLIPANRGDCGSSILFRFCLQAKLWHITGPNTNTMWLFCFGPDLERHSALLLGLAPKWCASFAWRHIVTYLKAYQQFDVISILTCTLLMKDCDISLSLGPLLLDKPPQKKKYDLLLTSAHKWCNSSAWSLPIGSIVTYFLIYKFFMQLFSFTLILHMVPVHPGHCDIALGPSSIGCDALFIPGLCQKVRFWYICVGSAPK